ncbi:LamG-like jellyroll fold domain-containing protein [Burkholderia pyrrocinia]|uniref:LamG-like jellyroll fold domain-containing protein n=1 Tax=Burkholderia pyrrocinia TaxID=60550 RepID=UPI0007C7B751|nr:LamG-like jellyroll fold domain-containing protein [Burkholderia pyrrocinia]
MRSRETLLARASFKYATTLMHLGRVFGFCARQRTDGEPFEIGYVLLSSQSSNPDDDTVWKDFERLIFPRQLRPVGHGVIVLDFRDAPIPAADASFQVISDDAYVYVFRQSTNGTLYVDRFIYDEVLDRLVNAWETRFRRSRKYDIPLDRRDTFGSADMEGIRFLEPTTELTFVTGVTAGQFAVSILPTELPGQSRWQIFAYDGGANTLNSFSIQRAANGLFDLQDSLDLSSGQVPPDACFALSLSGQPLKQASGPACVLYNRQERLVGEDGRPSLQKRALRLMLALAVGDDKQVAVIDFGIGRDGKLAQVDPSLALTAAPAIGTGLSFTPRYGTEVAIASIVGGPAKAMTFEAWLYPHEVAADTSLIIQSASGEALPFALWLAQGVPTFAVGRTSVIVQADAAVEAEYWVHLAATYDGTNATLFVNGQPYALAADGVTIPVDPPASGYRIGGASGVDGILDEVRLWNVARGRDAILATLCTSLTAQTPGWADLAGYWRLDEPGDASRFTAVANSAATGAAADGVLDGAVWSRSAAPVGASMTPIAWDANGLSVSGMTLAFASTDTTPQLVDGGDSMLHLYYAQRGNGNLMAAHFSTVTARASFGVRWLAADPDKPDNDQTGDAVFIARSPGAWVNPVSTTPRLIAITIDASDAGLCTVELRSNQGLVETWPKVPRGLDAFAQVINGEAMQQTDDPTAAQQGVVLYDYTQVAVQATGAQQGPQPASGAGSNLFSVMTDVWPDNGMPALMQATDGKASPSSRRAGIDGWWLYDPPLADIDMTDPGQFIQVFTADQVASYEGTLILPGDAALEAWVKPAAFSSGENATVLVFDKPDGSADPEIGTRYMLALDPTGRVISAKGAVASISQSAIAPGQWTHVAASYASDYGLQLGGSRFLDAGNADTLSTLDALTIEAWVRLDSLGQTQTVASRWNDAIGQGWSLYIEADGKLGLRVNQDTQTRQVARTVTSTRALDIGKWHHVAGVYTVEFEKQTAIMFNNGSYVKLPQMTNAPTDAVTTMMWIKSVGPYKAGLQILIQSVDPKQPVPFLLYLDNGVPTFTAFVGGVEQTTTASATLRSDDWIHIAGRYSATLGIELYIDGQSIGELAATPHAEGTFVQPALVATGIDAAYSIGGMATQQSFTGMINEVSIWNRGLTADEIRQRISRPPSASDRGLAGYWPFADLFGTTVMDLAGTSNGELVGGNFVRVDKGQFAHKVFIDGRLQGFEHVTDPIVPTQAALMLGSGNYSDYLQGAVGDIRLWKAGRMNWQIEFFADRNLEANAQGLISNWRFDSGSGRIAYDAKSDNNAVIHDATLELSNEAVDKMWIHTTFRAGWTIYIDGARQTSDAYTLDKVGYGDAQATIGAQFYRSAFARQFTGELIELRVWRRQRTAQQIRENMYTQLVAGEPDLAAYWPLSEGSGSTVPDVTGWGADGVWIGDGTPKWQGALAPVGIELPAIRNTLGGLVTPYNASGKGAPGARQYGALEADAYGSSVAVYQRAYVYVAADGALALFGNFKVGDLDVQYIGQAQMAPTLIGYIEGAPPVPAENLKVYPGTPNIYTGSSSIAVDEVAARTLQYTANRDTGFDMQLNTRFGVNFEERIQAGIGVTKLLFGFISNIGVQANFMQSVGTVADALVSNETRITARKNVELRGGWKGNAYKIDNGYGQIWFPSNMGYALVRSATADMYALRIRGTGALVSYQLRRNPDIPEDMNIIMFRLRPTYVKNGTLDGWIGFEREASYKALQPGQFGSYFKPLEAYALKQLIDREHQQLRTYFDNFDAGSIGRRQNVVNFQPGDIGDTSNDLANILMGERQREAISTDDWKKKMARRNMVNTYVWTADGGFYAEEEQFTAVRQEQSGGAYSFHGKGGFYTEMKISVGVAFELDALFGGHIITQAAKSLAESEAFSLSVNVNGERYIGLMRDDPDTGMPDYSELPSPGKVRGYRFMSFYLAPTKKNFDEFKSVVDEDWLYRQGEYAGSFDPDALALRQALSNVNEVWRVLHRVTYVSRVPPQIKDAGESIPVDARRPDAESITNNYWLIAELPEGADPNPMAKVSEEADALIASLETQPVWGRILAKHRAGVKEDIMKYMRAYYGLPSSSA